MLEEIKAWRASDGKLLLSLAEGESYEAQIQFRRWCERNICCGGEWSARMVVDAILDTFEAPGFRVPGISYPKPEDSPEPGELHE